MIWKAKTKTTQFRISGETFLIPKKGIQENKSLTSTESCHSRDDCRYDSRYDCTNFWHHPIISLKMKPTHEGVQNQGDHKEKKPQP